MTTQSYLKQIGRLDTQIQNKLMEIDKFKSAAYSITTNNEIERVQTSKEKDKIGLFVPRIVQAEDDLHSLIEKRTKIIKQIDSMEDLKTYDILAKKYILQKDEKEIASYMHKTPRQVRNILRKAHIEFEKKYGESYLFPKIS